MLLLIMSSGPKGSAGFDESGRPRRKSAEEDRDHSTGQLKQASIFQRGQGMGRVIVDQVEASSETNVDGPRRLGGVPGADESVRANVRLNLITVDDVGAQDNGSLTYEAFEAIVEELSVVRQVESVRSICTQDGDGGRRSNASSVANNEQRNDNLGTSEKSRVVIASLEAEVTQWKENSLRLIGIVRKHQNLAEERLLDIVNLKENHGELHENLPRSYDCDEKRSALLTAVQANFTSFDKKMYTRWADLEKKLQKVTKTKDDQINKVALAELERDRAARSWARERETMLMRIKDLVRDRQTFARMSQEAETLQQEPMAENRSSLLDHHHRIVWYVTLQQS